ncbi:MAG: PAS domain S-box protein [Verrucomicrobiota bacterium]
MSASPEEEAPVPEAPAWRALLLERPGSARDALQAALQEEGFATRVCETDSEAMQSFAEESLVVCNLSLASAGEPHQMVNWFRTNAAAPQLYLIALVDGPEAEALWLDADTSANEVAVKPLSAASVKAHVVAAAAWLTRQQERLEEGKSMASPPAQIRLHGALLRARAAVGSPGRRTGGAPSAPWPPPPAESPPKELPPLKAGAKPLSPKPRDLPQDESSHASNGSGDRVADMLRTVVENSPSAMALLDRDLAILVSNEAWNELFSMNQVEVPQPQLDAIFPSMGEEWKAIFQRCLDGASERVEGRPFEVWENEEIFLRWDIRPWKSREGKPGGLIVNCDRPSEPSEEEEKGAEAGSSFLKVPTEAKSTAWSEALFTHRQSVAVLLGLDGRILRASQGLAALLGSEVEELEEEPFWKALSVVDGVSAEQRFHSAVESLRAGGLFSYPVAQREDLQVGPDERIGLEWRSFPVAEEAGQVTAVLRLGQELKSRATPMPTASAEESRGLVLDSLPGLVVQTDADGEILHANARFRDFAPASQGQGVRMEDLLDEEEVDDFRFALRKSLAQELPLHWKGRLRTGDETWEDVVLESEAPTGKKARQLAFTMMIRTAEGTALALPGEASLQQAVEQANRFRMDAEELAGALEENNLILAEQLELKKALEGKVAQLKRQLLESERPPAPLEEESAVVAELEAWKQEAEGRLQSLREELEEAHLFREEAEDLTDSLEAERNDLALRVEELEARPPAEALHQFANAIDEAAENPLPPGLEGLQIADHMPFGVAVLDHEGAILYANPQHRGILGHELEIGREFEEWLVAACPNPEGETALLELWRIDCWRKQITRVFSLVTSEGLLKEIEIRPRLHHSGALVLVMTDVTESRHNEEGLRASEAKFRAIFKDAGVGIALVDENQEVLDANHALTRMLGFERRDLCHMGIEDWVAASDLPKLRALRENGINGSSETELRLVHRDGFPVWTRSSMSLVYDGEGQLQLRAFFFNDISAAKSAQADLRTSQEQNLALLEAIPDLILLVNRTGKIEDLILPNEFSLDLDEGAVGQSLGTVLPEAAPHLEHVEAKLLGESGFNHSFEFERQHFDGTQLSYDGRLSACGQDSYVLVIRDITGTRQSLEAIRRQALTFANISDAVVLTNLKGRIIDLNPSAERFFGYSRKEVLGKGLYRLYSPEAPREFNRKLSSAMHQQGFFEGQIPFARKDGKVGRGEVRFVPLEEPGQPARGLLAINRLTRAEVAPVESSGSVAGGESSGLLRSVHHRVKNNLQIIASLLNLQIVGMDNREAKEALRASQNRVTTIAFIHQQLHKGEDLTEVSLAKFLDLLAPHLFHGYHREDLQVKLEKRVEDSFRVSIEQAIPLALILNELLTNALLHAFANRPTGEIEVGAQVDRGRERGAVVWVRDNGAGLPAKVDPQQSPGLGLQIVQTLGQQLSAQVEWARSHGTECRIRFELR